MNKASLIEKFAAIQEHWRPKIVAQLNGQEVKLAKMRGIFPWHRHEHEDEMFLVVKGLLKMQFRNHEELVRPGEFIIVPRGVEHRPVADAWEK
jgi:quercetin dioxygenase-like cupin family protein